MSFLDKLKGVTTLVLTKLGLQELPVVEGKLNFTSEQLATLNNELGEERVAQMVSAFDSELAAYHNDKAKNDEILKAADNELNKILNANARSDTSDEDPLEITGNTSLSEKIARLGSTIDSVHAQNNKLEEKVAALIKLPEVDNPILQNKNVRELVQHSATHLFASGNQYDLLNRNWNARVLNPALGATDFLYGANIQKLDDDLRLYYRENPEELKSLERDLFDLPSFIKKKINVSDKVVTASVVTAEITQARKLPWLPKNNHHIEPEEGQVYPIQIDIQYVGYWLQQIEASWLNTFNKEGSQPYKNSFVAFLVNEIRKKQRVEDRMATINGIYVQTPEKAEIPGKFLNRQNGLMYLLWMARDVVKKYRPFNVGAPTNTNIVDYVDQILDSLPPEVKVMPGIIFNLSPSWLKAYKERYRDLHSQNIDYKEITSYPAGYSNIEFCTWVDMEGSDFMYITFKDNYTLMEMHPLERVLYRFEYSKRIIDIWADYKMGIMLDHIGNHKIKADDPDAFKVQSVWSNNMPIFSKRYQAYFYDDTSGAIEATHNFITVNPDWKTDITEIKPVMVGQVLKLTGSQSLASSKQVKKSADLSLVSDFDLKSGGTLTLVSLDKEGKWKELSRTTEPETLPNALEYNDVIDVTNSNLFTFKGTSNVTISAITSGVENQLITVMGGDAEVTIPKSLSNLKIDVDIILADAKSSVQFIYVDGLWYNYNKA